MPSLRRPIHEPYATRLRAAREYASAVGDSRAFRDFVEVVRAKTPWRFKDGREPERFLRGVETHLVHFVARLLPCVEREVHTIFDFGCGTGSSAISMAMVFTEARCHGVDISPGDVSMARERARLYGVEDRCRFEVIENGQALPAPSSQCDLCTCYSVLEYVTDPDIRKRCVQEMVRVLAPGGLLFVTVPNRLYPFEIHSRKFGWNYFPKLLGARMVGSHVWEIKNLADPYVLRLRRSSRLRLFTPWTDFGLERIA